jgi:hypothetical protein
MAEEATNSELPEQVIKGRSVFLVETTQAGIAVQTALLMEDGKLMNAPAIFPDVEYAFTQVDELKRLISAHFSQAARFGAKVAAQVNNAPSDMTGKSSSQAPMETAADPALEKSPGTETASNKPRTPRGGGKKTKSSNH